MMNGDWMTRWTLGRTGLDEWMDTEIEGVSDRHRERDATFSDLQTYFSGSSITYQRSDQRRGTGIE